MATHAANLNQSADPGRSSAREQINVVVVGHVDHGKSTLIGRLLADLGGLPDGKLEQIRSFCALNSRPFEWAFLLDALKNEQSQGITIETARCFLRTPTRDYVIHDAPGHVEFLKNMITGASRAEAALVVIDAHEGIRENSRRHGYLVSMLGIRQVAVLINKIDLVDYRPEVFERLRAEYDAFLRGLGVSALAFIPVSAREGANVAERSPLTPWYSGPTVTEQIDNFETDSELARRPLRMPVQDVYKFTAQGDDRRIVVGSIESGRLRVGDEVLFMPSGKRSRIRSIEAFNAPTRASVEAGEAVGFTLDPQIYVTPGELMSRTDQPQPAVATRFRANLCWLGRSPMVRGKRYKLKIGAARTPVELVEIRNVIDAGDLSSTAKPQVDRHDVGECVLETARPVAFDVAAELERTSRFVIVDGHDIAACGVALEALEIGPTLLQEQVSARERRWQKGQVSATERSARNGHQGKFIVISGSDEAEVLELAKRLEKRLFTARCQTYFLSVANLFEDLREEKLREPMKRQDHLELLGELAHLMTDAGLILITALGGLDDYDIARLRILSQPNPLFLVCVADASADRMTPDLLVRPGSEHRRTIETLVERLTDIGVFPEFEI